MNSEYLNDDELDYLDELLQGYGSEHAILDVNELDGFFTALVVSPRSIELEEWYPAIWGGEDRVPELESEDEAEQFEGLLWRMYHSLGNQLRNAPEAFSALFYIGEYNGTQITVVEEWCHGFMRGVALGGWPRLPSGQAALLEAISLHGDERNHERLERMSLEEHQQSVERIEPAVGGLYLWFRSGAEAS